MPKKGANKFEKVFKIHKRNEQQGSASLGRMLSRRLNLHNANQIIRLDRKETDGHSYYRMPRFFEGKGIASRISGKSKKWKNLLKSNKSRDPTM